MSVHYDKSQWVRLLNRFKTGWRGPCTGCADIGVGPQSFTRLVHQFRKEYGEDYIQDQFIENKIFGGKHKEYWINPAELRPVCQNYEQITMEI